MELRTTGTLLSVHGGKSTGEERVSIQPHSYITVPPTMTPGPVSKPFQNGKEEGQGEGSVMKQVQSHFQVKEETHVDPCMEVQSKSMSLAFIQPIYCILNGPNNH